MRRKLILLFAVVFFFVPAAAAAEGMTLEQLQAKFPDGKYWNHPEGTPSNQNGWTDTPCSPHSQHNHRSFNGACGCNCFSGLTIQCEGFAYQLQEDAFGAGFGVASYHHPQAVWDYAAAMSALKPGDVIRYHTGVWNHSIFITAVEGDLIVYADCNADNTCQIRWNVQGTKSMLAEGFQYMDPGAWDLTPAPPAPPAPPAEPESAASEPMTFELRLDSISFHSNQSPALSIGLLPPEAASLAPLVHDAAVCTVTPRGAASIAVPAAVEIRRLDDARDSD